jgi:prephenate dehydratase
MKTIIATSGVPGSFSEEAANKFMLDQEIEGSLEYAVTADASLAAVADGKAEYAVIPLENHNGGIVYETVYATARYLYEVVSIFEIDVQQNLLVKPGTKKEDITQIVSHQQGIAQCRFYLKREYPNAEYVEYPDTALATKNMITGEFADGTATIASRRAAELYKAEVLEPSIQDLKFNFTAFLAVKNVKRG